MSAEHLRVMRDQVFGQRSTDNNWEGCRENWINDETWLVRQFNRLPKPLVPYENLPWPKTHSA